MIPPQLQTPKFRFIRIDPTNKKKPIDGGWSTLANFEYNNPEITDWISKGNNYGVATGWGDLIVIDSDNSVLQERVDANLPQTFQVKTGGGGYHNYYSCRELSTSSGMKIIFEKDGQHLGEMQTQGQQVIGPGCTHPNGNKYVVTRDMPITTITKEDIDRVFPPEWRKGKKQEAPQPQEYAQRMRHNLSITNVVPLGGLTKSANGEYQGPHPVHGSEGGQNFTVNPTKNVWHCFTGEQRVVTVKGLIPIRDVCIGDDILGNECSQQKVLTKFKREYVGEGYTLSTPYSIRPLHITLGHPILICSLGYKGKHLSWEKIKVGWKNVEEINPKKDYLCLPKTSGWISRISIDINPEKKCKIPKDIELDYDLGYFFGTYLAEGHVHYRSKKYARFQLTMGYHEGDKAKRIALMLKEKFKIDATMMMYKNRGTCILGSSSTILSRLLLKLFGSGSHKKGIGSLICANDIFIDGLLDGWRDGDGYNGKTHIQISTVSPQLAEEAQYLLLRRGYNYRICRCNSVKTDKTKTAKHDKYVLSVNKAHSHDRYFQDEKYIYLPIKKIKRKQIKEIVYNLETQDHTYLTPFVVHNCFRHDCGGDPLSWIAVQEGIIQCGDKLDGDRFKATLKAAAEKHGFVEERPVVADTDTHIPQLTIVQMIAAGDRHEASEAIVHNILLDEHIYTTQNDEKPEMWSYQDGIYIPEAKSVIKRKTRELLGEAYTSHIVGEVINKIQADTFINQDDFFNNVNVTEVVVENGILNVMTRQLRPWTAEEVFFNKLPVVYDPGADCPIFKAHLMTVLKYPETDHLVIEEMFGYCLYKEYKIEKALMLSGEGRNGKSKTMFALKNLLGLPNVSSMTLQQLEEDPYAPTELLHKMANISTEVGNKALESSGIFKATTGRDIISCQRKFKSMVHFQNFAKMLFAANEIPRTKDLSAAFFSRWVIVEFPYRFVTQEDYDKASSEERQWLRIKIDDQGERMSTPQELSGILNISLNGLERLLRQGDFSHAKTNKEVRDLWMRKSDSFSAFCMDYIEESYESSITKQELFRAYVNYCRENKVKVGGEKHIKFVLESTFGCSEERPWNEQKRERIWDGIRFKKTPPKPGASVHLVHPVHGISILSNFESKLLDRKCMDCLDYPDNTPKTPVNEGGSLFKNENNSHNSHETPKLEEKSALTPKKLEQAHDGICASCGERRWLEFSVEGQHYCKGCVDASE